MSDNVEKNVTNTNMEGNRNIKDNRDVSLGESTDGDKDITVQDLNLNAFIGIYTTDDFEEFIDDLLEYLNNESDILEFDLVDYDLVGDDDWFVSINYKFVLSINDRLWFNIQINDKFYRDIFEFIMDAFRVIYIKDIEVTRDVSELIVIKPKKK